MMVILKNGLSALTFTNISGWGVRKQFPTVGVKMMRVHFNGVKEGYESKNLFLIQ